MFQINKIRNAKGDITANITAIGENHKGSDKLFYARQLWTT